MEYDLYSTFYFYLLNLVTNLFVEYIFFNL